MRRRVPISTRKVAPKAGVLPKNRVPRAQLTGKGSLDVPGPKSPLLDALPKHLHSAALDVYEALLDAWPYQEPPPEPYFLLADSEHTEVRALAAEKFGDRAWSIGEISYAFKLRDLLAGRP